jgi:CBS domain containing-hemolysin-like protein
MIRGVFDLSDTTAEEVMTPRNDVMAVQNTATIDELERVIAETGHSRIPIYEDSIDQIIGVVLARDLWRARFDRRQHSELQEFIRQVPFVPQSKNLENLLRDMQKEGSHIVVVLDEYGGTAGVVTVEDILEEIVGEIADEHEPAAAEIQQHEDGRVMLTGRASVAELNEVCDLTLPDHQYTTVAGYIMGSLGRPAIEGEMVKVPGGRFRVLSMDGRRIEQLVFEPEKTVSEGE